MLACVCGGLLEIPILIWLSGAIIVPLLGWLGVKRYNKKHGIHGDKNCPCDCHQDDQ